MELYPILWLIVAAISVVPMIVFWKGYFRLGTKRLRLTAIAFTLFFFKALTVSTELFVDGTDEGTWFLNDEFWLCVAAILDMIIISLIVITFGMSNESGNGSGNGTAEESTGETNGGGSTSSGNGNAPTGSDEEQSSDETENTNFSHRD